MNASLRTVSARLPRFTALGVLLCAGCATMTMRSDKDVKLELQLDSNRVKVVSVALGQSAMEVIDQCEPAKASVHDDPVLFYHAAGGGGYLLFFSHEDTRDPPDARRSSLYAVAHYPAQITDGGVFLFPETLRGKPCGDFVTLKVPHGPDKGITASVTLGMSTQDVKRLFQPAADRADGDRSILYDSSDGGKFLLIFSPQDGGNRHNPRHDTLSELIYRPGRETEALFLLPRKKRGEPLPAEYRTLLGNS